MGVSVRSVLTRGPAAEAELMPGDRVLAINQVQTTGKSYKEVCMHMYVRVCTKDL